MIIQRFNLNLIPNQSPVIVHVNQYDTGTGRLIATLYEGNEPYSPNGTAVIQGTKPDGHGFQYTATLDGNVVTADLTEQMSPVAGDVRTQIVVTESSGVTGTFAFIIRVQPSALPSDTDMSESDYQYIEEAIREAQEAVQTAQEATETAQEAVERAEEAITETQENAENSEAWAQGTRGGIPVEPTDPTYEHNAEYWAQYAERYAQGGLHYKGSIPFADIPTTGMREGDMYNITDDFTTDSRFEEGAGIEVKGGTNIAWNSDDKWDVLAIPPKTTFNGRSGSILPMAGDYDSEKILLSSILHIGGETQNDVQEALKALSNDGVKSFNGRSGSVLPMAGDYSAEQVDYDSNQTVKEKIDALVTKEASDIAGQQSLVKDTVGWTGKNRAYSQTNNAVIAHIENGITYDVSWTGSATVVLKKNSASGATITSGSTSPLSFTADADYELYFESSATVTNIMVKDSRITDPTYEPYHESVEVMYEEEIHGVNLLKNIATSRTVNGVTYTVNADGSVTANGTTTAYAAFTIAHHSNKDSFNYEDYIGETLILSGCPANDSMPSYKYKLRYNRAPGDWSDDYGEGLHIVPDANYVNSWSIEVAISSGVTVNNLTFKPMLRKATIDDPTYRPYNHQAIQNQLNAQGVLGAKNLLKNTYPSQTVSGVTITHNSDDSLSFSGTATAQIVVIIKRLIGTLTAGQKYILSGIKGGSNSTYFMTYNDGSNNPYYINLYDGDGEFIAVDESTYTQTYVGLYIRSGQNMTGITIKPMIRLASDPDDTYQPYAMTNRELTEKKINISDLKTVVSASSDFADFKTRIASL